MVCGYPDYPDYPVHPSRSYLVHFVKVFYSIILYGKVLVWYVCGMSILLCVCVCVCSGQSGEAQRAVFVWFQPPSCSRVAVERVLGIVWRYSRVLVYLV